MINSEFYDKLEKGKQLGKVFSFCLEDQVVWSSVAIQKWGDVYKVYIDEIFESKMASEEYDKELIGSFCNFDQAIAFIKKNSNVKLTELVSLKGQRIFNPSIA